MRMGDPGTPRVSAPLTPHCNTPRYRTAQDEKPRRNLQTRLFTIDDGFDGVQFSKTP